MRLIESESIHCSLRRKSFQNPYRNMNLPSAEPPRFLPALSSRTSPTHGEAIRMFGELLSLPCLCGLGAFLVCLLSREINLALLCLVTPALLLLLAIPTTESESLVGATMGQIIAYNFLATWIAYSIRNSRQPRQTQTVAAPGFSPSLKP